MLLDLNALRASGENVPAEWRPYVDVGASGFVVRGDRTSARELFLSTVANRVLLCAVLGLGNDHFWRLAQETCAVNVFDAEGDATYTMVHLNDTSHLQDLAE